MLRTGATEFSYEREVRAELTKCANNIGQIVGLSYYTNHKGSVFVYSIRLPSLSAPLDGGMT